MDKVFVLDINDSLDSKLKEFQGQLKEGQQIVHTTAANGKLIITIRETKKKNRNLLLEEYGKKSTLE